MKLGYGNIVWCISMCVFIFNSFLRMNFKKMGVMLVVFNCVYYYKCCEVLFMYLGMVFFFEEIDVFNWF